MAETELRRLYHELVNTEFSVVHAGKLHIKEDIYPKVKSSYSSFCNDSYLCAYNCRSGHDQPEWKHVVRRALNRLKNTSPRVTKGERNYWIFK